MRGLASLLLLALVACGESHPTDDAGPVDMGSDVGPDLDAVRAFLHDYVAAACAGLAPNCTGYGFPPDSVLAQRQAECEALAHVATDASFYIDLVASGRAVLDPAEAAACLAEIAAGVCVYTEWLTEAEIGGACSRLFGIGPVHANLGDRCSGLFCAEGACTATGLSTRGCDALPRCRTPLPLGAPCDDLAVCAWGPSGAITSCVGGVCTLTAATTPAGDGGACGTQPDGTWVRCAAGLYCTNGITAAGRCGPRIAAAGLCPDGWTDSPRCPVGSTCRAAGGPGTPYTCTLWTVAAEGETCDVNPYFTRDATTLCDEPNDYVCGIDHFCHRRIHAGLGGTCGTLVDTCADGLACHSGVCVTASVGAGAHCYNYTECASGFCGSDNLCVGCATP